MSGFFYGIGVGPGDPELMTIKAVRLIRESDVIAVPGETVQESVAYKIARQAVPEMAKKQLLAIPMPMTHEKGKREENHRRGAERIEKILGQGMDVAFLTLGDPTVYSTFFYLQELVKKDGYQTETVSGVPSFCAAAARVQMPLVMWNEPLFVVPAAHALPEAAAGGTTVYMKAGRKLKELKEAAKAGEKKTVFLENCGMEHERICEGPEEIPDEAGYYSLLIVKDNTL